MKLAHRVGFVMLFLATSVGCDQATKRIATNTLADKAGYQFLHDTFRLTYAENPGAFLSLGASLPPAARFWVLTICVGLLLVGILAFALLSPKLTPVQIAGYALIAGGGLSNWFDRAMQDGKVVDFMNMGIGPLRTGVFNVADLAIVAGIAILFFTTAKKKPAEPAPPAPAQP